MAGASTPYGSKAISLKLLVDSKSRKVLFAEAGKEFVDFLFGLMHIPIGSIMGLLWNHGMAGPGSWSRVYESIKNLDSTCLHQSKEEFLMPEPAFPSDTHPPPLLLNFVPPKQDTTTSVENQFSSERSVFGLGSLSLENRSMVQHKETGYVRGVGTFMVMDDLTVKVKPMSTISSITLLNTFNVKDVGLLQEKTVNVDIQKGLELVKASFGSTTVLTDVFLGHTAASMEDTVQASMAAVPAFNIHPVAPPQSNFVFGSTPIPLSFVGQQNSGTVPNLFQATNSLGGGFSVGAGGRDKSGRKIVKVSRKGRKK